VAVIFIVASQVALVVISRSYKGGVTGVLGIGGKIEREKAGMITQFSRLEMRCLSLSEKTTSV